MDHKDVIIQDLRAENKKLTEELKAYRQLEKKMHEEFQGHINTEMIVNSFITFYDMQEVNEELAECLLLTNENAKKYKEYKRLEEQGLLLKLPCKIGDTVYALTPFCEICEEALDNEYACENCNKGSYPTETKFDYEMIPLVGKTIFLTEQEAQSALEKMKGE